MYLQWWLENVRGPVIRRLLELIHNLEKMCLSSSEESNVIFRLVLADNRHITGIKMTGNHIWATRRCVLILYRDTFQPLVTAPCCI